MASDTGSYLRKLKQRGYTVPATKNGNGHVEVWHGDTLVATTSATAAGGRSFANFKAQVRRYEQDRTTRKTRVRRTR
jgi:hypothetical protein